jgi:acyl-CoA thioester hydrolase
VVFNSHYLLYADEALTSLLRALGTPYDQLLARGLDTAVVASELSWVAPARYGDVVEVDAEVERIGRTSFTVAFAIGVADQPCCRVRTSYVLTDLERRPTAVPDDLREAWLSRPPRPSRPAQDPQRARRADLDEALVARPAEDVPRRPAAVLGTLEDVVHEQQAAGARCGAKRA